MSRTRLAALAVAALALTGGGATWALTGTRDPAAILTTSVAARGALPSTVPAPAGTPPGANTGTTAGGPGATAGTTGKTPEKAAIGQPAGSAARKPARRATPEPFVQTFAGQPGVTRHKPRPRPTAPVKVAPAVDGCDRAYGTIAQCIPVRFPAGVTDKCSWLRDHGYRNLKVTGRDHLGLDPDRNGTACDK